MPQPRKALVSVDTTPSYHVVSRCVRRTFLFGVVDNKDFSHRRDAIVRRLSELTHLFCIDISAYAIMSNHYHLVVRLQKQRALDLSVTDAELKAFLILSRSSSVVTVDVLSFLFFWLFLLVFLLCFNQY